MEDSLLGVKLQRFTLGNEKIGHRVQIMDIL